MADLAKTYYDTKTGKDVYASEGMGFTSDGKGGYRQVSQGSANGGTSAYDSISNPSTLDFINKSAQPANEANAAYIKAMQARMNPMDIYKGFEDAMGIPGQRKVAGSLREQVYGLEDAIKGVRGQVEGTTRESMINESQRQRLVQKTQQPLQENLGTIGTALGRLESSISSAEQQLATKVGLAMQGQAQDLEPLKASLDYAVSSQAIQLTGFTADKASNLQIALQKIQRGEQLSDLERTEAFTLLQQENAYTRELEKLKIDSDARMKELTKQASLNQSNSIGLAKYNSGLNITEALAKSGINKDEAKYQQGLDIEKSFKQYRAPSSNGNDSGVDNKYVPPGISTYGDTMWEDPAHPGTYYRIGTDGKLY